MRMYEVYVDESFAAAHNLRGYKGKCEDLHGHNYKVRVTLAGPELDSVGLLYDFVHLKQVIHAVIRSLDHKYLNEMKPFDVLNPSAENIARYIYDETARQLRESVNGANVASITVWETDVTAATYRP
jgi:6-pyruvoyltetrahydropterin/6-carboxytetrahydropterin synthase